MATIAERSIAVGHGGSQKLDTVLDWTAALACHIQTPTKYRYFTMKSKKVIDKISSRTRVSYALRRWDAAHSFASLTSIAAIGQPLSSIMDMRTQQLTPGIIAASLNFFREAGSVAPPSRRWPGH
jgi:hypothetical protein